MRHVAVAIMFVGALASGDAGAQTPVNVFSAGSLRAPQTESERPYRLIIPDNVHTSRWIRQVERIIVRQVDD